ncbi:hypothetical protein SAMN05216559_2278 [Halomicrobium zhouii]|uniref:Uncharacterized protein n=1 Tax=Halomicrobium zhouii TaxID=767519 RepID=A0A1I6L8W4_9EURY|nr:hypothetical protein [Halomicrobium zhouii]SFR99897.1 hypothetical protein SAMN05216559_2278 [Halomicrobium zhouii]
MPARWSRRRTLTALAALPATSLAGCTALQSYDEDDEQREYSLHVRDLDEPLAEHLLWSPDEIESSWDELEAEARRGAIEDGRYTTYGYSAINDEGEYTAYEGSYYRLSVVVTGEKSIDRDVLRLRWVGDEDDEDVPEADVAVEDLPDVDSNAAMIAYFAARGREHGVGAPDELTEHGGYVYRQNTASESVLVPDPEYETVSTHGTVLRVDASVERIREPAYSVVATELGDSMAEYADAVDGAQLDVRLSESDLSEEQRRMFLRATGDGYAETAPLDEPFADLLDALDVDDVDDGVARKYLRYDGRDYQHELYVNTV